MTENRDTSPGDEGPFIDAAARLLAYDERDPHLVPLDDLAKRRFLDGVLAEADRAASSPPRSARSLPAKAMVAAAVVLACGAVVAAYLLGRAPSSESGSAIERAAVVGPGFIAMVEGEVLSAGVKARAGAPIDRGAAVETGEGRAIVSLPTGVGLMALRDTAFEVHRLDDELFEVFVRRGEVAAVVAPGRRGPPFEVSTVFGAARAKGTVFAVRVEAKRALLQVERGVVEIREGESVAERVEASQAREFDGRGHGKIAPFTEAAADLARTVDFWGGEEVARLRVDSAPAGAAVRIGDVAFGFTPIELVLRPGHRDVRLSIDGHAPVNELVDLSAGDVLERRFVLEPLETRDAAAVAPVAIGLGRKTPVSSVTPAPGLSLADMLRKAQDLRTARLWDDAASAYEAIVRAHPSSPHAMTALVSLGSIELDHLGRPEAAASHFREYLEAGGSLSQEAAWGRARALRAMKRTDEERAALEEFVSRYPESANAPQAQRRLLEIAAR